jgi:hypothetical protein
MTDRNISEDPEDVLFNVGVMLRASFLSLEDARKKNCSDADRAALARIKICLVRAYEELNRLETAPAQRSASTTADILSFEDARHRKHGRAVIDSTPSNPHDVGLRQ